MTPDLLLAACRVELDRREKLARDGSTGLDRTAEWSVSVAADGERVLHVGSRLLFARIRVDDEDDVLWRAELEHMAANDPASVLTRIAADRELLDVVMSWRHRVEQDSWFSCSQATKENGFDLDQVCSNDNRRGGPCDCGLTDRQLRILEPLARGLGINTEEEET